MTREEVLKKYKHTKTDVEVYFDFDEVKEKLKTVSGYGALWEYSVSHQRLVVRLAIDSDKISTDNFVDSLYIYCNETDNIIGETKIPQANFEVKKMQEEGKAFVMLKESLGRLSIECASCYIIIKKKTLVTVK